MLISHKHKFICISIPKTGTRSLRETLCPLNILDIIGHPTSTDFPQHGIALECKQSLENLGYNFDDYFSFCVVRNPWDRYLSFFKYYKERAEEYLKTTDFKEWKDLKIKQGKFASELFTNNNERFILKKIICRQRNQSEYFLNTREIIVSHIARFENLQNEFDYLCETIGLDKIQLSHGNKSINQISCSDIYNQELIDLVAEKEKEVIDLMSYVYK